MSPSADGLRRLVLSDRFFFITCRVFRPRRRSTAEFHKAKLCATCSTGATDARSYLYDPDGQRVAKLQNGSISEQYYYDADGHMITDANSSGNTLRAEIYAGERHLATWTNNATYFNHADWLGTERVRTNSSGAACETITSLPFGDGQVTNGSCTPTPTFFTGKERDLESGNDYFGARYYGSTLGRFMTPDWAAKATAVPYADFGDPQSLDLYSYVLNNPLSKADADGHCGGEIDCGGDAPVEETELKAKVAKNQSQYDPKKSGPEDPTNPGHPLSQNAVVKKASDLAFMKTVNGTARSGLAEAGFSIEYKDGKISIGNKVDSVNSDKQANELVITTDANTIAIFHTHGNAALPTPSEGDRNPNTQVPDFVRSQRSLYVTIPNSATGNPPLNAYIQLQ